MIIDAKAPRGKDLTRSVCKLTFQAESEIDCDILAAILDLWETREIGFCDVIKARVTKIISPSNKAKQ